MTPLELQDYTASRLNGERVVTWNRTGETLMVGRTLSHCKIMDEIIRGIDLELDERFDVAMLR